jgi:hypothetical protein
MQHRTGAVAAQLAHDDQPALDPVDDGAAGPFAVSDRSGRAVTVFEVDDH